MARTNVIPLWIPALPDTQVAIDLEIKIKIQRSMERIFPVPPAQGLSSTQVGAHAARA